MGNMTNYPKVELVNSNSHLKILKVLYNHLHNISLQYRLFERGLAPLTIWRREA